MEKFAVFNPEGGLGKIIASTAVATAIKNTYPDRKLVIVTPWPAPYLNNPDIYRVYLNGSTPYFYEDYVKDKDTIFFKGEPYFSTQHILRKQHVIKSWCELFKLEYNNEMPQLFFNPREIIEASNRYKSTKPFAILQTSGGMFDKSNYYSWTRDLPPNQAQLIANGLYNQGYEVLQVTSANGYKLQNVTVVPELLKRDLLALLTISKKRILIDSCLQHAAAAISLKSTVCWIGTSHVTFGYNMHTNVYPIAKVKHNTLMDSFLFDYDFNGPTSYYPYETLDLFDVDEILNS